MRRGTGRPGQATSQELQCERVEALRDRTQARLRSTGAQRTHRVAEEALGLSEVVRLSEALTRKHLVSNLAVASTAERVVGTRTFRRPFDELAPGAQRRVCHRATHRVVALRVDHNRTHPTLDSAGSDPRLRHRLT